MNTEKEQDHFGICNYCQCEITIFDDLLFANKTSDHEVVKIHKECYEKFKE